MRIYLVQGPLERCLVVRLGVIPELRNLSGLFQLWVVQHDPFGRPPQPQLHHLDQATQVRLQWLLSVADYAEHLLKSRVSVCWESAGSLMKLKKITAIMLNSRCSCFINQLNSITCFNVKRASIWCHHVNHQQFLFPPLTAAFSPPSVSVSLQDDLLLVKVQFPCAASRRCSVEGCCPVSELIDPWTTVTVYNTLNQSDFQVLHAFITPLIFTC